MSLLWARSFLPQTDMPICLNRINIFSRSSTPLTIPTSLSKMTSTMLYQSQRKPKLTPAPFFRDQRQPTSATLPQRLLHPPPSSRPLRFLRLLRPVLTFLTLLALLAPSRAARPGFKPQPPDTEGREPATLLVTVPASVLLPSLVAGTADRAARALHVSIGSWRSRVRILPRGGFLFRGCLF